MPRAEVGTTKYLNNKLKSKGLQRLRWYCQVCERQMRDENGFKMHVQSESHVRQMVVVGENSTKFIQDYSNQFQRDFLQLLRTAHGEKKVNANHFYQEYIAKKAHVHMNSTRWTTLTEFVKQLGREGICRVDEGDRGLEVAWIDNSPEALRRQDAVRKKERQDKGDEEREQRMILEQVERARREAKDDTTETLSRALQRDDGAAKIKLELGPKVSRGPESPPADQEPAPEGSVPEATPEAPPEIEVSPPVAPQKKPKNVFSVAKRDPAAVKAAPARPMSEAERIMKAELAAKEQSEPPRKRHKHR